MFKVEKISKNKVNIQYNTKTGFKDITLDYNKPLFTVAADNKGSYHNLDKSVSYEFDSDGEVYPYECFRADDTGYDKGLYFNTLHLLDNSVFDEVVFPNYLFYDIETDYGSLPVKKSINGGVPSYFAPDTAVINSIAWINEAGEEFVFVRGLDGSEKEILEKFLNYLTEHNITCCIGHNNYNFDDILIRDRARTYNLDNSLFKKSTNQNNLDTLVLARLFNYIAKDKSIKLDRLAEVLDVSGKLDLDGSNPILLYHESVKNNDFTKFKNYNLQDCRVTRDCFNIMDSKSILTELFNLTRCPFNKMISVVQMLNHYTCNLLFNNKILVPTINNPKIEAKNMGGYNYIEKENTLLKYENILCLDIISYYPHLFMLIHGDTTFTYPNFNTITGEVEPFNYKLPNGLLSEISSKLYDKRASIKKLMKETTDELEAKQLDSRQKVYKILINGQYGACDSNYDYIMGSHKISTLITNIGRELLKHLQEKYHAVYTKTDSIFLKLDNIDDVDNYVKEINNEVTYYLKNRFNLNNFKNDGTNIIRFAIEDRLINELIIKSKNEYIKILPNGNTIFKGGSFTGDNTSEFETDLIQFILKDDFKINEVFKFCDESINNKPLNYFSKEIKLNSKTPNQVDCLGRYYMENQGINYSWDFKYNGVRVESNKYDWVLYPNGHSPDLKISPHYIYELAIKFLLNNHLINLKKKQELFKNKTLIDGVSINKYNSNKDVVNEQYKDDKKEKTKQVNNTLDVYQEKEKTVIKNEDRFKGIKLKKILKLIPDTKEYAEQELIKLIPLNNQRKTKFYKLKKYLGLPQKQKLDQVKYIPQIPSGALITGNDNVGVYVNSEISNLCCLDIDGAKNDLDKETNHKLVDYLKGLLIETGVNFIIQKTQSDCYHLFYTGDNNFSFKGFKFPNDFFIEKLRGHDLEDKTIEVPNNNIIPLAPTKTKIGEYKLLDTKYTWSQIFQNPCNDMFNKIKEVFLNNGFTYKEPNKISINKNRIKYDKADLITLEPDEITEITSACIELLKIADKKNNKHTFSNALGGYFQKYIQYESAEPIIYKVGEACNDLFNHKLYNEPEHFINTVLNNYESNKTNLTGFPTMKDNVTTDLESITSKKEKEKFKELNKKARDNLNIISDIIVKEIPHKYIKLGVNNNENEYGFRNNKIDNVINYVIKYKGEDKHGRPYEKVFDGDEQLLFCFHKIELINGFNVQTQMLEDDKPTKYNFIIKSNRFKNEYKTYNDITLKQFINKIENLNLTIYNGNLEHYIRLIIHKFNDLGKIRAVTKPYNTGVYVYKDKIMLNTPYLNTDGDLNKGLEVFNKLINDVFLNDSQYICILNLTLLSMLSSVFKTLQIANGVNKVLYICGAGETLKTFVVLCGLALFDKDFKMYESTGGDTNSAIFRRLSEDTLPLDIHDGKINPSSDEFKNLIKSILFGFNAQIISDSQYGNDINIREAYRTLFLTLNNNPNDFDIEEDDGEDRRILAYYFTHKYKTTKEQKKAIRELISMDTDNRPYRIINNISSIGYTFLKFIQETIKPYELTTELIDTITDDGGVDNGAGYGLIKLFWEFVDNITNGEYSSLCNKMNIPFNSYTDFVSDKKTEILYYLRKNFEHYTESTDYEDDENITDWITKSPLFIIPEAGNYDNLVAIDKKEFNHIIKYVKTDKDTDYLFKSLFDDDNVNITELNKFKLKGKYNKDIVFYPNTRKDFNTNKWVCYIERDYVMKYLL